VWDEELVSIGGLGHLGTGADGGVLVLVPAQQKHTLYTALATHALQLTCTFLSCHDSIVRVT
jgi:hypothetical protein